MTDTQETVALAGAIVTAAAGAFAGAYKWLKSQIESEVKATSEVLRQEIESLKTRVEALEANQNGAISHLMVAYGLAMVDGKTEIAGEIKKAEVLLR